MVDICICVFMYTLYMCIYIYIYIYVLYNVAGYSDTNLPRVRVSATSN
jgi:hypothetical protein